MSANISFTALAFCVLLFFKYCASSAIEYLNIYSFFLYDSISLFNKSYDVIIKSYCGILFILFYFDTRIKSKSEVEELLGLEVLGVIPEIKA